MVECHGNFCRAEIWLNFYVVYILEAMRFHCRSGCLGDAVIVIQLVAPLLIVKKIKLKLCYPVAGTHPLSLVISDSLVGYTGLSAEKNCLRAHTRSLW